MKIKHINSRLRFIVDPEGGVEDGGGSNPNEPEGGKNPEGEGENRPKGGADEDRNTEDEGKGEDEPRPELSHEDLTKELERTRRESANYRTKLREAQEALKDVKSTEQLESVVKDLNDKIAAMDAELVRERVARKAGLPDELVSRLKGSTEDELTEDANALLALIKQPRVADARRLNGGLSPDNDEAPFDPVKQAKLARRRY